MNRREFIKKSLEGIVIFCCICSIPLISGCKKNPVESEPDSILDSNSIIKDNIKYYMQTDKKIYNLGENVEMLYRVTNLGNDNVDFAFCFGPKDRQCRFTVEKDEEILWDTNNLPVTYVITYFTLGPFQSRDYVEKWDMLIVNESKSGYVLVDSGIYNINGWLQGYINDPVSVPIKIIQ